MKQLAYCIHSIAWIASALVIAYFECVKDKIYFLSLFINAALLTNISPSLEKLHSILNGGQNWVFKSPFMIDPFGLIDLGNDCLLSGLKRLEEDLRRDSLLLCLLQIFRRDHRIGLSVMTPKILIKIIRKTIDLFGPLWFEYFSLISVGVKKSIPEGIVDLGRPKFALTENILLGNTLTLL